MYMSHVRRLESSGDSTAIMTHRIVPQPKVHQNRCHDPASFLISRGRLCPCSALRTGKWLTSPPTPSATTYPTFLPTYSYAARRSSPRRCHHEWPGFSPSLRPRQRRWPSSRANWRWPSHRWAGKVGQLDQLSGRCCGLYQQGQQDYLFEQCVSSCLLLCYPCDAYPVHAL